MSFIKGRLRRLEGRMMQGGRCPECGRWPHEPGHFAIIDDGTPAEGFPANPAERCSRCDRPLWCVVRLVYEEEGEGARADA